MLSRIFAQCEIAHLMRLVRFFFVINFLEANQQFKLMSQFVMIYIVWICSMCSRR